jgi:hypothetical protein
MPGTLRAVQGRLTRKTGCCPPMWLPFATWEEPSLGQIDGDSLSTSTPRPRRGNRSSKAHYPDQDCSGLNGKSGQGEPASARWSIDQTKPGTVLVCSQAHQPFTLNQRADHWRIWPAPAWFWHCGVVPPGSLAIAVACRRTSSRWTRFNAGVPRVRTVIFFHGAGAVGAQPPPR